MKKRTTLQAVRDSTNKVTHRIDAHHNRRRFHSVADAIFNYLAPQRRRITGWAIVVLTRDAEGDNESVIDWRSPDRMALASALEQTALEIRMSMLEDETTYEEVPWDDGA